MRNAYSAKIASTKFFEDTQTVSVLAVCKTENGHLIEDTFVSFYMPVGTELGEQLLTGVISEIGFHASGFSEAPIRKGNTAKNLKPVYALINLDRDSVRSLLSVKVQTGKRVTSEEVTARNSGIAARAAAWLKGAVSNAKA